MWPPPSCCLSVRLGSPKSRSPPTPHRWLLHGISSNMSPTRWPRVPGPSVAAPSVQSGTIHRRRPTLNDSGRAHDGHSRTLPGVVGNLLYVVRLHDDKAARLSRKHRSGECVTWEDSEPCSELIVRLHSEGYHVRCTCPSITPSSAPEWTRPSSPPNATKPAAPARRRPRSAMPVASTPPGATLPSRARNSARQVP